MTPRWVVPLVLFAGTFGIFNLTNYGGIRSPDSEVVYRLAEAMVDSQSLAPLELEAWKGFGIAAGADGKRYSIYPPFQSVVEALWLPLTRPMATLWDTVPVSHYYGTSLLSVLLGEPVAEARPHAERFSMSFLDVAVSSFGVVIFYLILLIHVGSREVSAFVSGMYAFGTIAWSYAGSFFSEPLALLLVLSSYYLLVRSSGFPSAMDSAWSGILLGLSSATHVTAMLFVPFFPLLLWRPGTAGRERFRATVWWFAGFLLIMLAMGYYNHVRFGDWLESGRNLSQENKIDWVTFLSGDFWHALTGLLVGSSKGLLLFVPLVAMSVFVWPSFHRDEPWWSRFLIGLVISRLLFNALYKDWHAGYSLGPRYLLLAVPFALIPVAWWLRRQWDRRALMSWTVVTIVVVAAIAEQWYFVAGDIFSFYHAINFHNLERGINVFEADRLYLDPSLSPLGHLLDFRRGPFFFRDVPWSNAALWIVGSSLWAAAGAAWWWFVRGRFGHNKTKNVQQKPVLAR